MEWDVAILPQEVSIRILILDDVFKFLELQRTCAPRIVPCVLAAGLHMSKACNCALKKECHMCKMGRFFFSSGSEV